ncbi:ADP-ribosylglycohydrolase family protein [Murimonas intestini]|uniref:ADP-ribosylglycohydrolase n=1 Tax=Murimonas intestini TaxID=1337051 RepID=A0AB73SY68_9FIRM|nr:ADP-ribosylglycohydrolase family protein [Murimonas intestini]MCR1842253.1 ADP-ribosylglycohydrolase family protein [Murimonas intestini]MCR1868334.1 ADP-ribosylglycohydrolase family protein [Murimonas intestini]MCR1885778.1 ADP-ribosylglycohydrolase family protein [Murimonas intestini]
MITRQQLLADRELLTDKATGALCGLAIGDSFGDAARMPENQRDYGFTTDFNKGASWSTDDTEFALLVAETIISRGGDFTSEDVVEMWLKHVATEDELKRGGVSEVEACNNLRRGLRPPLSGKFNPYHQSDGAAMRSGPIGIYCAGDPEKAAHLAETDASVSHYNDGIWGAQAVAAAVSLAMVDASTDEIWDAVLKTAPEGSWFREALLRADRIIKEAKGSIADAWMPLHNELFSTHRSTVAEALPEVFGCLRLESSSFKSGLLLAANFGRDADTIGAVAGAVLGARYGAKSIPERWLEKTRYPSGTCLKFTKGIDIFQYAQRIAELMRC